MENSAPVVVLVVTADDVLLDHALAVCAAAGVEPEVVTDAGASRPHWSSAALVVVGADQAERTAQLGLPRRSNVLLLELADEAAQDSRRQDGRRQDGGVKDGRGKDAGRGLAAASLRLGAPVAVLPDGAAELVAAVAAVAGRGSATGRVVAVVGGSGGVGASTCAAALAFVGARSGRRSLLVDLDHLGGGLDLLVGAERTPGWRWPRLAGARGQLGDLSGQLPRLDAVDLVAAGRTPESIRAPGAEAVAAVVGSGRRSHGLVVLDAGRAGDDARAAVALADVAILVVAADVRGVAAGREAYACLGDASDHWHLLVRRPRAGGLNPADAADGFEPALLGTIDDDPALALAAERGEPPARPSRSPLARLCRHVLDTIVWPGAVAA